MADVWVDLRAPRFVQHRHNATLHCDHNVDSDSIYKVVFYKDGRNLMRYIRNRDPPYEIYNITGATVDLATVSPSTVTLEKLDFPASGSYACEIALETPLYSKVSKLHELNIIVRQKHRPKIKIKNKRFSPNDFMDATCQSAPAHPAPHLTWFINNAKVDEKLTIPHGTMAHRHHHGMPLAITSSSLHFPLPALELTPNQTVDVTCLSTIPSYASVAEGFADVQNYTISVIVRVEPAPTQLPRMILSPENASSRYEAALILLVFMLLVLMYP
ncbi:hypothetical protein MSG28_006309 [Choristoneura fumiferana]|uniref:Uncharacterized protein n=2 Tax=Choristoneura fumiferana TaxID=7141 RepID=A0ACC0JEM5_CHOFU|nr:hypothetical protein MSG28_006309 [Choristoneura fumiferana]